MAYTSTDLDAVRSAIAKGERMVTFADRSVTYRSVEELLKVEQHIMRELDAGPRPRQWRGYASKGLC